MREDGKIEILAEKDRILERKSDSRGRISLPSPFSEKTVQIAILSVEEETER